jgi:hypothetical protein
VGRLDGGHLDVGDEVVAPGGALLGVAGEDLVELLAWAQASEDDVDGALGLAGQGSAASAMRTGVPMSSTSTSPSYPIAPAWITSCTASEDGESSKWPPSAST